MSVIFKVPPSLDPPVTAEELAWWRRKRRSVLMSAAVQTVVMGAAFGVGMLITGPAAAHFALFKLNLALGAIMIVMLAALNLHLGTLAADVRIKREMDKASALEAEFLRELALDPET